MKKILPIVLAFLIGAAAGALFVMPGFHKRTDIDLQKFSVSDDGSIVTIQTFPEGSMGFIRAMEAKQFGDEIHCSFYSCFGGLNSSIGSEYRFDIQPDDSAERIYFDRGTSPDVLVLERDPDTGVWAAVYPHLPQV